MDSFVDAIAQMEQRQHRVPSGRGRSPERAAEQTDHRQRELTHLWLPLRLLVAVSKSDSDSGGGVGKVFPRVRHLSIAVQVEQPENGLQVSNRRNGTKS